VYRFDPHTELLEDLEVWVHTEAGDVKVLDIDEVVYDVPIAPEVFTLKLPDDVVWFQEPEVLPDNDAYAEMSPHEAARLFFEALASEDWDEALNFSAVSEFPPSYKDDLGGLEIINLGDAFQSGRYPGWFVPYEIKLKSGGFKKHNLALRNDNKARRWIVDGGM
jgi:hypothetical protein